ncbi:MAG: hypothetical protein BBJ57_07345 [Desulfobacterales bacterium PC51MH44]|nr:MAG: hypothetical protein BBJ57_07345 [Desulfobacterales bacterium PC51MH44]
MPKEEVGIQIIVDEYKDRVRLLFNVNLSYVLLHPKDSIKVGEAIIRVAKDILTVPPKGVKPN